MFSVANIQANSGDKVSTWVDAANNNNAIQNNLSSQAIYTDGIFIQGNIPGLLFENNQEYSVDLSYLVNQKYTVAIVEARTTSNHSYIFGNDSSGTNSALHSGYRGSDSFTFAQFSNDLNTNISAFDNSIEPVLWLISNNSRGKEIYRNGILIASNNNTDDLIESNNGRIGSALGNFYQGYLGLIATWVGDKTLVEIDEINAAVNSSFGVY